MNKYTVRSALIALVATFGMGQAQAATFTVNLTGTAANPVQQTVDCCGLHYAFSTFALQPVETVPGTPDLPITVHQGDIINSTITFDAPVSVPGAPVFTGFTQFFFGSSFPAQNTGVNNGMMAFFLGGTELTGRGLQISTTTSGDIAAGGIAFSPDNTPFSFDYVTTTFTINDLATEATLDRSSFEYVLVSPGTASAVPEPAIWAMMLLGFGAIGWSMRTRKQGALAA